MLGGGDGERLAHFADAGEIFIGVGPATGSSGFALGTQQVRAGKAYRSTGTWKRTKPSMFWMEAGVFSLNEVSYPIEKGATIFIPKNAWHGFTTPEHELLLLWVMAPAGLDGFFRETCNPPGVPPRRRLATRSARLAADMERSTDSWSSPASDGGLDLREPGPWLACSIGSRR